MEKKIEGNSARKRKWTAKEILERLMLCVNDDHCARHCNEEPCVLEDVAFLRSIACTIETQRAEIRAQKQASEGHRVMAEKLREELQKSDQKYIALRRKTLLEVQKLLEKEEREHGIHG